MRILISRLEGKKEKKKVDFRMASHTPKRRKLSSSPENDRTEARSSNISSHGSTDRNLRFKDSFGKNNSGIGNNGRAVELSSATGSYKSSFFKLHMYDLLTELRPNYDTRLQRIRTTLHLLKEAIERFPEKPPKSVVDAEKELRTLHGVIVPFPEPGPGKDAKYTLSYSKPANINVVGSFSLRNGARTTEPYVVDLAVTMPSSIFQENDYLNFRYFYKRAYYIACVAAAIRETKNLDLQLKFDFQDGESLRPTIIMEPHASGTNEPVHPKLLIRIVTAIEASVFPISRTLPMRNNVRHSPLTDKCGITADDPTPRYNSALRAESTVGLFHKHLHSTVRKCESFGDACAIGRIWLCQRGFRSSLQHGGFGGFEWDALMSLLLEGGAPSGKPVLSASYSSYQLFKATLQFIAGRNLMQPPLVLFATDIATPKDVPVLYDGKRGLNILYKMTRWSYAALRHEATITLKMLNESRYDNFDSIFVVKTNEPALRFDRLVSFPFATQMGNFFQTIGQQYALYDVLSRALGNRVKLICLSSSGTGPWKVDSKPSTVKVSSQRLSVGLLLDPENAAGVVDHGPSVEKKEEAAVFRSFWGEKAELRRFKDGSILESIVWSDHPSSMPVIHQILVYALHRHFNISEEAISYLGDEYDDRLRSVGNGILSYSDRSFQAITNAFNSLERAIQNMDDVPLVVRQLSPAGALSRYTAVNIPGKPVDLVLQFESSGRWPDDLAAIQMTKIAFLVKIGDSLQSSGDASFARVGLENESSRISNNAFLDIVHRTSVAFRLRIHHDREQTLLERRLKEQGNDGPQEKEELAYALSAYKRLFIRAPRLTQAIRTLCTRFPLLSPTIRLMKNWFNAHLLATHVSEELIELLTARTFTQPYPWDTPSSIKVGFLRTLHFLSRWDWQQEPLIVDLSGELKQDDIETIYTRFSAWRRIDPAMNSVAFFAASDIDHDGVTWTQHEMPPKVVAARITTLAKAAMKLLREKGLHLNVNELFYASLAPYDFVINLHSKALSSGRSQQQVPSNRATIRMESFVGDLQACYSQSLLLFRGDDRCPTIGGLWNPQSTKVKSFSLKLPYSTSPVFSADIQKTHDNVNINRTAILNEISRLGGTMIERIESS